MELNYINGRSELGGGLQDPEVHTHTHTEITLVTVSVVKLGHFFFFKCNIYRHFVHV